MSFFLGLAEGVEAGLQKRERDEEREAQQARYDEQRAWTRQMHAYRVKQDRITSERQAQKDALDAEDRKRRIELEDQALQTADEELRLKRIETFLPYMNNPSLASALGGSGSKAGLSPMSPATIAKGSIDFKFHFDELPTDTKKDPFFQALSKSPEGQAAVIAFMSAQAAKSNTVPLQDMPKYFKYLGATEGQNEQEAAAFLKSITEGDADITDTDTFIKGLLTLNSYRPVKHVFAQIDAPISASDINTQYEGWVGAIKAEAEREFLSLKDGSERKTKIKAALSQARQSETEIQGLANLASLGFGRDLLESQGYIDNYRITSFYETEGKPEPTSTTPPPGAPSGVTIYNNWDEVSKAREKGSLGNFMVTGDNTIYEDQEEGGFDPVVPTTPTPEGANKEDEFITFKSEEPFTMYDEYNRPSFGITSPVIEGYNIPARTVEERIADKRESVGNVREKIVDGVVAVDEALADTFAGLDQAFVSNVMTANEKGNTFMGAAAQMVGADDVADFFYEQAIKSEDAAKNTEGLIPAINNVLDKLGVPDLTRDTAPELALDSAVNAVLDTLPTLPISDEEAAAAAARAPAHVEKLGKQTMDAWRKLTAEVKEFKMSDVDVDFVTADEDNPMLKLITTLVGEETPKEKVVEYANVFTRATDTPASKQLQQLIVDQLGIADNEAKKIVVESKKTTPEAAVNSFVQRMDASQATPSQQEIADLKTMLELHQIILPSRPAYTPPAGDVAKAFRKSEDNSYGTRGLPQQGDVLPSNLDAQQGIDTPPVLDADELPELPRNMTVESMLTRRDRGAGLMKRPSVDSAPVKPEMAGSELVALRSTMQRVHGKKSDAIKELDKIVQQAQSGIPIQYTDVNRLLRMTKSLRKSETRDKLIEQLAILANEARR